MNVRARQVLIIPPGLESTICAIWNSIAPEIEDMDGEPEMTNEEAIEACLDADRLLTMGDRKDLNDYLLQSHANGTHEDLILQLNETVHLV